MVPPSIQSSKANEVAPSSRRSSGKRKRPPTPSSSDGEITLVESSPVASRPPPRKRLTRGETSTHLLTGSDDVHINRDLDAQTNAGRSPETTPMLDDENVMELDHDAAWEQYNAIMFGPDVTSASTSSSAAGPSNPQPGSAASSSTVDSVGTLELGRTPVVESDLVTSNLLSSQKSFSNLNIYSRSHEDPYGADADFGFDF